MRPTLATSLAICGCLAVLAPRGRAVAAPPAQDRASHPVLDTYAQARQYRARVTHQRNEAADDGRQGAADRSDYLIALDRDSNRFMLDSPEFRLVQDGPTLRILARQFPGRYLELQIDPEPDLAALSQHAPMFFDRPLVDAALLLSDQPVGTLSGGTSVVPAPAQAAEGDNRLAYEVALREGRMDWRVDPQDHLLLHAGLDIDRRFLNPGVSMRFDWDYDVTHYNTPLPDDTFAFDTTGRTAVATLQELLAPGGAGSGPGAGGGPTAVREAADFTLPRLRGGDFHFKDDAADVVVLHFWTTWMPGGADEPAMLQELHDWAAKQPAGRVQIFLVGFGESAETLEPLREQADLTLPILIDEQMSLAQDYGVATVPQTLIIADGEIRKGYSGVAQDFVEVVRKDVEELLAEQAKKAQDEKKAQATQEAQESQDEPADPDPAAAAQEME